MGKNSPSKRRYWDRIRIQWAPVLRAVREFAIVARKAPKEEGQSLFRDPSVRQAALNLMAAAQNWHSEWSAYRVTSGKGFKTPEGPAKLPKDDFHRLQRACKAYGYSLRPEAGQTEKAESLLELLNCALEAPLGSGVFRQAFSAEEWCIEAMKRFPELNKDEKSGVL